MEIRIRTDVRFWAICYIHMPNECIESLFIDVVFYNYIGSISVFIFIHNCPIQYNDLSHTKYGATACLQNV